MTDSFTAALNRESQRLLILRPGDDFDPGIAGVIIGPTKLALLAAGHVEHVVEQREAGHFATWHDIDLARFYRKAV